eukprot:TRINITY_DN19363_c0_g1_i1.p1 TRINITY_DN19363_c0_g1~~TRINITY_DN19363_c0_g1_i1.p1  ORF type:complete len:368 (-),score=45.66 TRINITY_DN19363_c0_g1_i1:219-1322(-)
MEGNHLPIEETQGRAPQTNYRPAECLQLAQIDVATGKIAVSKTPDKSKRDEWSEGGVVSLLEVYESKWLLRNRAKLKGSDWDDIARQVSDRNSGTKTLKTPNQCKNKIESMKKRYRAESSGANNSGLGSSWQFYGRMDGLLKGANCSQAKGGVGCPNGGGELGVGCTNGGGELGMQDLPKVEVDESEHVLKQVADVARPKIVTGTQNCETVEIEAEGHMQGSNQDDGSNTLPNIRKDSRGTDSDVSTPRSKVANAGDGSGKVNLLKRKKSSNGDVAESIRLLAHSILKIEQARVEMYKDSERLRAEAEIRRGEMELKRTEIIAKTQLQIAKILSRRPHGRRNHSESSSLRADPTALPVRMNTEGKKG